MRHEPGIEHEPALGAGRGPDEGDAVHDEPALHGAPAGPLDPSDAVGEEPALSNVGSLPTYAQVYHELRHGTSTRSRWASTFAVGSATVLVGFAVIALSWIVNPFSRVPVTGGAVFAPVLFALVKASIGLVWVERRPWLVPNAGAAVGVVAAPDVFVAASLIADTPTVATVVVAVLAFAIPGLVAGLGVARVWEAIHDGGRRPDATTAVPWLAAAAGLVTAVQIAMLFQ